MKRFGKKDFLLIGALFALALVVWAGIGLFESEKGAYAVVTVDGTLYGRYSLDKPQEISITVGDEVTNVLQIKDEKADMIHAECPDQLCVHQHSISKSTESIVCLPNKVVVTIEGAEKAAIDSLAK